MQKRVGEKCRGCGESVLGCGGRCSVGGWGEVWRR